MVRIPSSKFADFVFPSLVEETIKDDDGNTITSAVSVTDTINLTLESHKLDSATGTSRIVAETFSAVPAPGVWTLGINNPTTYNLSFDAAHGLIKDPTDTPTHSPTETPHCLSAVGAAPGGG